MTGSASTVAKSNVSNVDTDAPLHHQEEESTWLDEEFEKAVAQFNRSGLFPPDDLLLYVSIGLQRIEPAEDFYQPLTGGSLALIVPVYAGPMPSFMTPVDEDPGLVDLVAFRMCEPGRWWLRTGVGSYLSEHLLRSAVTWEKPLRVLATPFAWLNARGEGVCPLTKDYLALRDPPELRFDEVTFASQVERMLARPFPIPRILVAA